MRIVICLALFIPLASFSMERARYTSTNKKILIQRKNELSPNQGYCKAEVEITNRVRGKLIRKREWIRCAKEKGRCPGNATSCLVEYRNTRGKLILKPNSKFCKDKK